MNKIKLTGRLVNSEGKIVGYQCINLSDGTPIRLSIHSTWIEAKSGLIQDVIAIGNPILPPIQPDGGYPYPFPQSELSKMKLRGINGFKISQLPSFTC